MSHLPTAAAASGMLPGATMAAEGGRSAHPDAELIAGCGEYLRIQREFEAYYVTLLGDIANDDPAWAILDPLPDLRNRIAAFQATTAEGHYARACCAAFHYLPGNKACQDDPGGAAEDRFRAANLRDAVNAVRGTEGPAAAGGGLSQATHPDADLLEACAAFDALERASHATYVGRDGDDPEEIAAEAERQRLSEAQEPLVERICEMRAVTREGMAARARSLTLWDLELMKEGAGDTGTCLTAAIVRGLLRGGVWRDASPNAPAA